MNADAQRWVLGCAGYSISDIPIGQNISALKQQRRRWQICLFVKLPNCFLFELLDPQSVRNWITRSYNTQSALGQLQEPSLMDLDQCFWRALVHGLSNDKLMSDDLCARGDKPLAVTEWCDELC